MKSIKLLLTKNVNNLGIVGDVIQVKPGYARNYLLPGNMATTPTKGNIARLAEDRKRVVEQMKKWRSEQEQVLEKLQGYELTLLRSANEQGVLFGSVSQHDIAEAIRADGFAIEDRAVRIGEQIKRLDSYDIPIVLETDLRTEIKLWIVSDKPTEELETDGVPQDPAEQTNPEEASPVDEGQTTEA